MPWALSLAFQCYDMPTGRIQHYPQAGGVWEQDEQLMSLIGEARYAWHILKFKPDNKLEWTDDDAQYIAWVNSGD
jgi:hypothetical protein